MKYTKKIIPIILLLLANLTFAATIIPIQLKPSFFEKVSIKITNCKWHVSCYFQPQVGTTLTTITGTDTVQNALKVITNANFTALNTGKFELSDWYATTTAPQLTTLGTITTGTWNASTLTVAYGGTGSTTLSAYHVLIGNGTGNIGIVSGLGTSGQFLTSGGAGTAPTWTTSSINEAGDYTWTGAHSFNTATTTMNATTSIAASVNTAPLLLNGIDYAFPSSEGASSTSLMTNGSGVLTWNYDTGLPGSIASDTLQLSADTERTLADTGSYTKKKEIRVYREGTVRVKMDLKHSIGGGTYYTEGRVYVNGVAVGSVHSDQDTTYTTYSDDISVNPNDLVQAYIKDYNVGGYTAYIRNFRIYYTPSVGSEGTIETD